MLFQLNTTDDRPIYAQIADQVKFAVAAGVLRPGELVPSVRELSKQLVVNPNTVARAYRDLQGEGLLEPVRGTGLQVAAGCAGAVPGRAARSSSAGGSARARGGEAERPGPATRSRRSSARSGRGAMARRRAAAPTGRGAVDERSDSAIRIEGLTKRYRGQAAVDGLSLRGPDGLGLRPAGRERRGQDDDDPDPARPDRPRRRAGRGARARPDAGRAGGPPPGRLRARAAGASTTG